MKSLKNILITLLVLFFTSVNAIYASSLLQGFYNEQPDTSKSLNGPGTYKINTQSDLIKIPFELFRMDIRMRAEINGKEVYMLIDNGSLWDQLLFFGSPKIDSLELERKGEALIGGAGEGNQLQSDVAENIYLKFPGIDFYNQTAIITPYIPGFFTA